MATMTRRRVLRRSLLTLAFAIMLLPTLAFFYWLVLISLRSDLINSMYPPEFLPHGLTLDNYRTVIAQNSLIKDGFNSLVIAVGATVFGLLIGAPAAFSIARWRQQRFALGILVARIIPAVSYLIPWFVLFSRAHLIDTYTALILTNLVVCLPLITWILISFFEDLPPELIESARLDGCTVYGAFLRIALPLARPGMIAASIISLIFAWNNFLFPVVLSGSRTSTLPLAAFKLLNFASFSWGQLAATAVLITLPIVIISLVVQRYLVSGLTVGSIK
jgi:multiple sugar transport system permease protein